MVFCFKDNQNMKGMHFKIIVVRLYLKDIKNDAFVKKK